MIIITKNVRQANVITHSGNFHSDDVLATVILNRVLGELVVSRVLKIPENLDNNVVVYDIGLGEFDHHQHGRNRIRENGVPYASVGLIWKKYGLSLLKKESNPQFVWNIIDRELIQGVDATDNGVLPELDYPIQPMSFSKTISAFNPTWDSEEDSDKAFLKAVTFADVVFENVLKAAVCKAKAKDMVEKAIKDAKGGIMLLNRYVPWQESIFSSTNKKAEDIKFVIFPSNRGGYNWQCVPNVLGGFGQRKSVPGEWKGLKGAELQKVSGVNTATFCHMTGFLGTTEILEDAILMANKAVNA